MVSDSDSCFNGNVSGILMILVLRVIVKDSGRQLIRSGSSMVVVVVLMEHE